MSLPVKLSDELVLEARLAAKEQERSIAGQVEFWAKLGRSIDSLLEGRALRRLQAQENLQPLSELIRTVEEPEGRARLKAYLDSEPFPHFEAHPTRKGFLIRHDKDGSRSVGRFVQRKFQVESAEPLPVVEALERRKAGSDPQKVFVQRESRPGRFKTPRNSPQKTTRHADTIKA